MVEKNTVNHIGKVILLTAIAMIAFAANSLLCRLALGQGLMDAASFSLVRVLSGALVLSLILRVRRESLVRVAGDWRAGLMLFTYMVFFSFAYVSLGAGTGALVLFGAVQLTMFSSAIKRGEHFSVVSWGGLALAVFGLVYLVSPGVTAPDVTGTVLMVIAGIAWGLYSLFGRGASHPLHATSKSFLYSIPLVVMVSLFFYQDFHMTTTGLTLAVASGAIASGCGYVIWYAALSRLSATRAATVQLTVPAIAAVGGVLLLAEPVTLRLVLASVLTLGGVAVVLAQRAPKNLKINP